MSGTSTARSRALDPGPRPWTPRRRQLVDVASRLFAQRGYRAVSLGDVCGELGLSGPAFYRHFSSKDELLVAVLDDSITGHLEQVRDLTSDGRAPDDVLAAIVEHHASYVFDQVGNIRTWRTDAASLPLADLDRLRYLQRLYTQEWVRALLACRPELDADLAKAMCHAAISLLQSPTEFASSVPPAEHRQRLVQMAHGALRA